MHLQHIRYRFIVIPVIVIYILLEAIVITSWFVNKNREVKLTQQRTQEEFQSILKVYEKNSRFIFSEIINKSYITRLFYLASRCKSERQQNVYRKKIHGLLKSTYDNMKVSLIRQLHFHFVDSTSFLRMHRPQKYGDSLKHVRSTVVAANRDRKFVRGFEEGRIFNGYRFVFPVFYSDNHIGSVEISVSMAAIGKTLGDLFGHRYQLILDRKIVEKKVFQEEYENYIPWPCSGGFLVDREVDFQCIAKSEDNYYMKDFCTGILSDNRFMKSGMGLANYENGMWYVYNFILIRNFMDKPAGYLIVRRESPEIEATQVRFFTAQSVLNLIFIFSLVAIYFVRRYTKKLHEYEKFLPICASCKKIRKRDSDPMDTDSWISIEEYFDKMTRKDLSHGICPDCYGKLYGDLDHDG